MSTAATTTRRLWIMVPSWKNRLKSNIDDGDPILYSGGLHTWVISGYDNDDKFYCIWGGTPSGMYNDYYSLGGFNPGGENYNSDEEAVFHIHPATHVAYELSGPDVVTSSPVEFDIENPADCYPLQCDLSPNLQGVYGGNKYYTVKAINGGTGWLDAFFEIDGQRYYAPRKYVTCLPY